LAEQLVADALEIDAASEDAERVRDSVALWFHTFALAPGIYTPGIARDHGYRLGVLGEDRFAERNEQYVDWVRARFAIEPRAAAGFRAIAGLTASQVEYRQMDALDVRDLDERFDVALCFGILHRVTDPVALLQALADVLTPGGEIVLETYGSRLAADTPAIEVREPGDVYARDEFTYWGFPAEGLRRLGRLVGLDDVEIVDEVQVDGHPRIVAVLRAAS